MGTKRIGFIQEQEASKPEEDIIIRNIDTSFQRMIYDLGLEEKLYLQEAILEKIIRKELVKIYKQIRKLEKKINARNQKMILCHSYFSEYPAKCLALIDEISKLDSDIIPEAESISQQISKHVIPEISDIYKKVQLSEQQTKNIRTLSFNLGNVLSSLMRPIHEANNQRQLESMRQNLLLKNPKLR